MAISLYTQSFGSTKANLQVVIRNATTQVPVPVYNSGSALLNTQGLATLDASGNLSTYVDTAVSLVVSVIADVKAESDEAVPLSAAQKAAGAVSLYGATADGTLVAPDGTTVFGSAVKALVSGAVNSRRSLLPFLPTDSLTLWTAQAQSGSGATFAVDTSVTLDGRPTIRVDIPAAYGGGAGGTVDLGTSGATVDIPYNWDRSELALALRMTAAPVAGNSPTLYIGDATFGQHWTVGGPSYSAISATHLPRANEWVYLKARNGVLAGDDWTVGTGTPATWLATQVAGATAPTMRVRIRLNVPAGNAAYSVWVGFLGVLPKKKRAQLIFCFDDGYISWYTLLRPMFAHYDMPVSMGLASGLVGGAFMSEAQIREMDADRSRRYDFFNHSRNNDRYADIGAAAYYANMEHCRAWMRGTLGMTHDGPDHHAYVQNSWGNDLVDLMAAGGYLTGRAGLAGAAYAMEHKDAAIPFGDKQRWRLSTAANLNNATSLAQAKAAIDDLITRGDFGMITGHDFGPLAAGAQYWNSSDLAQLLGYARSKVTAGALDVVSWSSWYKSLGT